MEPKIRFTNNIEPWPEKTIGEIFKFKNGLNKGKDSFGFGSPIINYTDVYKNRGLTKDMVKGLVNLDANEIRRYRVEKGDVFFTRTSETPEEVGLASVLLENIENCSFSGFVLRGRPVTNDLEFDYCKECFSVQSVREYIIKTCTYTTRALTNGTVLSKIPIAIPSKEEQKAIASYFTYLDSLIQSTTKKIESLKQVKAASLQSMFPQEGETTPRVRFKGFNGEWENIVLGKICSVNRGVRITRKDLNTQAKYPVYQNTDYPMGYFNHYNVKGNNPFVIIGGSAGLIGFSKDNFWAADDCAYFGDNANLDKIFLYNILLKHSSEIKNNVRGSSVPRLDRKVLVDLKISIPFIEEQKAIASYFTSLDTQISLQTQRLEKLKQIKSACLDNMFV